jgi:hypothetical protein
VASPFPHAQARPVPRWTLDESAATVLQPLPTAPLRRSSLWRLLPDVDRQPHQSAYWLHSPEEDCEAQAHPMCPLDVKALEASAHGRLGLCGEEKTARHGLERTAPTTPAQPGRRERRAQEDLRRGTRVLLNSLAVATGQRAWTIGATRTPPDVVAPLQHAYQHFPRMKRYAGGLDTWHTHWSLAGCRVGARWCTVPVAPATRKTGGHRRAFLRDPRHRQVWHCPPQHGAWLNHAAWFFGPWPRRFLARGSLRSSKDCERRVDCWWKDYNTRPAHPYRWPSTGEPLVRETPFRRPRRQHRRGRAGFSPRPQRFERLFYSPRPSRRQAA